MKKLISLALILTLTASAAVLSACGKKDSSPSAKTSDTPSAQSSEQSRPQVSEESIEVSMDESKPKITQTQLDELNKKITAAQSIPKFTAKEDKIIGRDCSKDLTVSLVSKNSASSYHKLLNRNFERGADRIGFKSILIPETDGTVSKINDGLSDAVAQKSDMILLSGDIKKDTVSSYIETAQAHGIEVISSGSRGTEHPDSFVDYTVPIPFENAGELMADWGIVKTQGKLHALIVSCTDSVLAPTIFTGFKKEFEKYVSSDEGSCTIISGSSIELGNGLANKIKSALTSDPQINYIFVFDDNALNDTISATVQAGSAVKIVGTGGSTEDMDLAQSGSIEMLVAHSYEWISYAMIDYAMRLHAGLTLPSVMDVPFRVLTKDVIKKAIDDYKDNDYDGFYEICFGDAFITGYNNLWSY